MKMPQLKLCLVTNMQSISLSQYKKFLSAAIAGGVTLVQLREKQKSHEELLELAIELKAFLQTYNVPLIINDHVDIAVAANADGVHLGQDDLSIETARCLLGPQKIIGLSIENEKQLLIANDIPNLSYVAASSIFPTLSKNDCKTIWGIEGLKKLVAKSFHPMVAIGGINHANLRSVMQTGVTGVAVISAIAHAESPKEAASTFIKIINEEQHV